MYRILIVDDEALVRRGIKKSVNWNELGIEMVAEAANGVEALSQVLETIPDIILLDINMPKMDGLEFASIIKKQYPKTKIVIITGYHDFEYARSALRVGVDDYIVKPITKECVEKIVKEQLETIAEERADETAKTFLEERRKKTECLNNLLKNGQRASADAARFAKMMNWDLSGKTYYVLVRDYLTGCEMWSEEWQDSLAEFAILNIADEILGTNNRGMAFQTYKNEMALLVNGSRPKTEELLHEICGNVFDFLEIPLDMAVSEIGTLMELPRMAEQANDALNSAFVLSDHDVIFYRDVRLKRKNFFAYPEQLEIELMGKMFSGSVDENLDLIDEFFARLAKAAPDVTSCKAMLLRLFLKVANTMESVLTHTSTAQMEDAPAMFDPVSQLEQFDSLEEAHRWLRQYYADTCNYMVSIKSRTGQLFMKIKAYIEQHYGDSDLNLKKCSEELFLSPNYIGSIIKKESGKSFVDYLNDFRIKKAAELLTVPENKVYEVSTMVGFTHPTYFSSVFKKAMSVSPRQFKENL